MQNKILLTVSVFIVFMLFNYVFALFAPTPWGYPVPVWMFTGSPVKQQYFKKLNWHQKLRTITMTYEGGNIQDGKGGIRTEVAQVGTPEFLDENRKRMEEVGKCVLSEKEGYWEYYVQTFTFFNIPTSSGTISCNSGLVD